MATCTGGIARAAQRFPDDFRPSPIPEVETLIGLISHPSLEVDLYPYAGTEQAGKTAFTLAGKGYGYGSPLFVNSGCSTELNPLACTGNTAGITQATNGAW
jgi:hypothetical protein